MLPLILVGAAIYLGHRRRSVLGSNGDEGSYFAPPPPPPTPIRNWVSSGPYAAKTLKPPLPSLPTPRVVADSTTRDQMLRLEAWAQQRADEIKRQQMIEGWEAQWKRDRQIKFNEALAYEQRIMQLQKDWARERDEAVKSAVARDRVIREWEARWAADRARNVERELARQKSTVLPVPRAVASD